MNGMHSRRLHVGVVILVLIGIRSGLAADYHYHFYRTPVALRVDPNQVAVHRPEGAGGAAAAANAASTPASIGIPGWALEPRATGAGSAQGGPRRPRAAGSIEQFVAAKMAEPGVSFVSPVFLTPAGKPLVATASLLIGFTPEATDRDKLRVLASLNGLAGSEVQDAHRRRFRLQMALRSGIEVLRAANALLQHPAVQFAEPDMIFSGEHSLTPNDAQFSTSWHLRNTGQSGGLAGFDLDAETAWDITTGDASIIVAVLDNGIEQDHPDLNQIPGTDVTDQAGSNPYGDAYGVHDNHGTAVGGCISGLINNSIGGVGIAPGVKVASIRTFKMVNASQWTSQSSWTVNALAWAQANGVKVTCNSNGYGFNSAAIDAAYQDTYNNGMVHFAAAGNSGTGSISYPASIGVVNAIAASNRDGTRASFSQYGTGLDFIAPGQSIVTCDRTGSDGYNTASGVGGDYTTLNGTSFATPLAAGVAALLLSAHPTWSPAQVEAALQATALDMGTSGYDVDYGWGHLDAAAALSFVPATARSDFNGDGKSDLIFFNVTTGQISLWLMNGTSVSSTALLDGLGSQTEPRGTGDFNGDGQTDIVLFNFQTGQRLLWLMNGTAISNQITLPGANTSWVPCGSGDFNQDGKADLVYYNPSTGQRSIWLMDGTNFLSAAVQPGANTSWQPQGVGDFNNDGKDDMIFWNVSTGQRSIWLMNGTTVTGSVVPPGANTVWKLSGAGDFNSDGRTDLVYYNVNTGQRSIWLMNGTAVIQSVVQPGSNTTWVLRCF